MNYATIKSPETDKKPLKTGDFMQAKPQKHIPQIDLIHSELELILDLNHELCLLADRVNWDKFEQEFAGYFPASCGKPSPAFEACGCYALS